MFGAIGLLACNIARIYVPQYNSAAGSAFIVTLILLILIICIQPIRTSSIFLKIEIIICVILCICYVVGSIDICRAAWSWLFDNFRAGPFIGSLIAAVCIISDWFSGRRGRITRSFIYVSVCVVFSFRFSLLKTISIYRFAVFWQRWHMHMMPFISSVRLKVDQAHQTFRGEKEGERKGERRHKAFMSEANADIIHCLPTDDASTTSKKHL